MADRRAVGILRHIGDASRSSLPDAALLAWFVAEHDEAAFAELVRRHGPLVLGVCRRVTRHQQDAEDAFQATFLTLARKAGRIARPELLASWLYGVAYRVARKAWRAAMRRRAREGQVANMPEPVVLPPEPASDLAAFLDAELAALPERFRAAIVLCDLYELSRTAAAERLGIPEGTLSSRLNAGRKKLAARLARRGVTLPAAGLGVALGGRAGGVSPTLAARTVSAVLGGVISATVQQLAFTGGASMAKAIGWATAACAAIGLAAGVVSALPGEEPAKPVAKTAPAKAAPAKTEEPQPDKERATIPGRPRMIRRVALPEVASYSYWSPDGKWLAVPTGPLMKVFAAGDLKPHATFALQSEFQVLGFLRDQPVFVAYREEAGSINAENKLEFWKVPESAQGDTVFEAPASAVPLDPEDGRPFALLPDNKTALSVVQRETTDQTNKGVRTRLIFRLINLKNGQPIRDVLQLPDYADDRPGRVRSSVSHITTYNLSPDGHSLFLGVLTKGNYSLERWDITTGKRIWQREIAKLGGRDKHMGDSTIYVYVSPDGKLLSVGVPGYPPMQANNPGGMSPYSQADNLSHRLHLFDAATGAEGVRLEGQSAGLNNAWSFSSDGRLLVGEMTESKLNYLVIWDTKSGKILKRWRGRAIAAFSPVRPILAILEQVTLAKGNKRQQSAISVLGLWDVAPLLKAAAPAK